MNQTLAIILTLVVTNWTHIGDFKDTSGKTFDVQEGRIQTNTVVDVYWNEIPVDRVTNRIMNRRFGSTNRFVLKSVDGLIVDRRLIEITNSYIIVSTNYILTNLIWIRSTNTTWLTNIPIDLRMYDKTNLRVKVLGLDGHCSIPAIKLED